MPTSFDDLFPPLPLPAEMRQWDAEALALGLPEELLMENAARAAFDVLREYQSQLTGLRVWLLMGSGNNGGSNSSNGNDDGVVDADYEVVDN